MSVTWKANKTPSAPGGLQCTVKLLDGTDLVLELTKKTEGQVLFEQVIRRLEITKREYFGLEYEDENKLPQWVDLSKPVKKQLKRTPLRVWFKVRHYPLDPMVSRPSSRTQFYQQVRMDIGEGKLRFQDEQAPALISLVLQADLGDFESIDSDIEYMCDQRLVSNEDITLQEEISRSHELLRGANPKMSVNGFLRRVRDLDSYGLRLHDIRFKNMSFRVGLSPRGLCLYQRSRCINIHDWSDVAEVSYKSKRLSVTVKDKMASEKVLVFECESTKSCKELWGQCIEAADFYSVSGHRQKEDPTEGVDMFGYPLDSLDEPREAKLKKSRSLPHNLPGNDPVLLAAMAHRAANNGTHAPNRGSVALDQPMDYREGAHLGRGDLTDSQLQLYLPDMPQILSNPISSRQAEKRDLEPDKGAESDHSSDIGSLLNLADELGDDTPKEMRPAAEARGRDPQQHTADKSKDGMQLAKQWVQEQQLKMFNEESQNSTSSSSMGVNLEHLQPSPRPSPPHPLDTGPPKPPRNYYPGFDNPGSYSKTLPSPKRARNIQTDTPVVRESPLLQYKSSEATLKENPAPQSRSSEQLPGGRGFDPLHEIDDLMNELSMSSRNDTSGADPRVSVLQAKQERRASEIKLRQSQRLVTQLLSPDDHVISGDSPVESGSHELGDIPEEKEPGVKLPAHLAELSHDLEDVFEAPPSSSGSSKHPIDELRRPSGTSNLPPAIANFMTRVRSLSPDSSEQSDELTGGESRKDAVSTPTTGHVTSHMTSEPRYDSPKLVRMEMSEPTEVESKNKTLKESSPQQWIEEAVETRTSDSVHTASVQFSTTVSMSYEPSMTVTSDSSEGPHPSGHTPTVPANPTPKKPVVNWYSDQTAESAHRPLPSPLTPMSQHTHSDLAAFQYPVEDAGYNTRPDTGQQVNQANPRSSNYRPVSNYPQNTDIRRNHTFSNGRESGWSQRQEVPRATTSPSDDSLPNSPTYFIHNNPNDDRDTPSPATQAQNELFQNHLRQLENKGSRKFRVLNWMQQSSTESRPERERGVAAMRRDLATSAPMIPYQKQAPVYASIDDVDQEGPRTGRHTAMGGASHMTGPGDNMTRPHTRTGDQKFGAGDYMTRPHTRAGLGDQRFPGEHMTRPHTRTGDHMTSQQRRPGSGDRHMSSTGDHMTRPGNRDARNEPRHMSVGGRANTRQPASQIGASQASNQVGASRRAYTFSQARDTGGTAGNTGYPSTKYAGKDFYVIDV